MGRKWRWAIAMSAVLALTASGLAEAEKPTTIRVGNLVLEVTGGFAPRALPRAELTPIKLKVSGTIASADGSHPPALEKAVVDVDKNGAIDARGTPTCRAGELEARTTSQAERVCGPAIVGRGTTGVQVQFPEQAPIDAESALLAFNGGVRGKTTTIFVHAFLTDPVPTAVVTTVKITRLAHPIEGRLGIRAVVAVPKIANGDGSITDFELIFEKRMFGSVGSRHAYLLAKCPDGHLDTHLTARFSGGEELSGGIVRACTPKP
jgi:hypothetical protein